MFTPFVLFVSCMVLSGAQTESEDILDSRPLEIIHPECPPNEVWSHCVELCAGEDSCYDRYLYACPDVFEACLPACVCKEGFIRKTLGRECIPKEECGGPCDTFEQYSECKQISKETCSSIAKPVKPDDSTEACTPGCTCWNGYYRENETSPCLDRCLCPGLKNSTLTCH